MTKKNLFIVLTNKIRVTKIYLVAAAWPDKILNKQPVQEICYRARGIDRAPWIGQEIRIFDRKLIFLYSVAHSYVLSYRRVPYSGPL